MTLILKSGDEYTLEMPVIIQFESCYISTVSQYTEDQNNFLLFYFMGVKYGF